MVLPGLMIVIPQAVGVFFSGLRRSRDRFRDHLAAESDDPIIRDRPDPTMPMMLGLPSGQLIGSLIRFYLLFAMLNPAAIVLRLLVAKVTSKHVSYW